MEPVPKTSKVSQSVTIGPQNINHEILKMKSLEEFIKLKPPVFKGGSDPSEADTWLYSIKTIFDRIGVPPEYRVGFAAFLFEGAAEEWWDQKWSGKKVVGIAWKGFVELLRSEFACEAPDWDAKIGFRDLVQTNSVAEYRARFEVLSCCDPTMETDPASKCAKFVSGLKPGIRAHISPFSITDFKELADVALGMEADLDEDGFLGSDSGDLKTCECPARQRSGASVDQYCAEFAKDYIDGKSTKADRVLKCIRFRCGLSPGIKSVLNRSPLAFYDFDTLIEAAKRAEATIGGEKKLGKEQKRKKEKEKQKKEQHEMQRLEKEKKLLEKQKQKEEKRKHQEEKQRQIQEMKKQQKEEKQKRHLERMKQEQEAKKRKQQLAIIMNTGPNWGNKKAKFN